MKESAYIATFKGTAKAMLTGKFIALNAYVNKKEEERSQINSLTNLRKIEKDKQTRFKASRKK